MHSITIQPAVHEIGGHNDGGFVRCSKSDGVQKAGVGEGKKEERVGKLGGYGCARMREKEK